MTICLFCNLITYRCIVDVLNRSMRDNLNNCDKFSKATSFCDAYRYQLAMKKFIIFLKGQQIRVLGDGVHFYQSLNNLLHINYRRILKRFKLSLVKKHLRLINYSQESSFIRKRGLIVFLSRLRFRLHLR